MGNIKQISCQKIDYHALVLNIKTEKEKLWTYTYAKNAKEKIDNILKNKKWNKSALNCEA